MIINHNMASVNTLRQMGVNEGNSSKSLQKLSSGLRINNAADDAAGLAISEKMRGQIRGLDQASRNSQDGISMIQTAEGSLNETHSILQRMKELATQSANDTNTTSDRSEIQKEMNQLTSEINRIGNTTEFNTQKLLKGKDLPVTTTTAATTTLSAGEAGVTQGVLSNFAVNANSIVGSASSTTVQASSSATTGKASAITQTTASTKAIKSAVTLTNGITFQANTTDPTADATLNTQKIEIKQATGASQTNGLSYDSVADKFTFTIGTDASSNSLATNRGDLYNILNDQINNFDFSTSGADTEFKVVVPSGTNAGVANVAGTGTFSGGVNEIAGDSTFSLTSGFKEAGDTLKIGGQTFTAVLGAADASKRQFSLGTNAAVTGTAAAAGADLSGIAATAKVTINVDGTDYTIANADLAAVGVATTNAELKDLVSNATDANGNKLSSVADIGTGTTLSITSKQFGGTSAVQWTTSSGTAGDVATIDGVFKIATGAAGAKDSAVAQQAASLQTAIQADATVGGQYTVTNTAGTGSLQFVEKAGKASGIALAAPVISGAGTNDTLTISDAKGNNLSAVTIKQAGTTAAAAKTALFSTDLQLTAGSTGTELNGVTIKFSGTTTGAADATTKATWDKDNATLTVTGALADSAEMLAAIKTGLTAAGFNSTDISGMTVGGTAANGAGASLAGKSVTFGGGEITTGADTTAASADSKGNLTIYLSDTTASNNTAANIQKAIQALSTNSDYKGGIDFSKYTTTSSGSWDTKTLGNALTKATGTMVGGKTEVKGDYSFEIATAFKAGDIAEVAGIKFKAVESGADAAKGEFNVGTGDVNAQAAGLADAISLNSTLAGKYDVTVTGFKIDLTEKTATGSDLQATNLAVKAVGTAGEFSVDTSAVSGNGGSFTIDGTEIKVSNKEANVGYAKGTAIKESTNAADQTKALVDAINKNATLSPKYTASVGADGNLLLKQNEGEETATAPVVTAKTAPQGDYQATLQVGANAGQSMTIQVADMRSAALAISGDGSESTVAAKDGQVASYVTTANVTNGTTNTNEEFALDVSTHDKATAAISVLDDAIQAVSAERSKLGAYQNRLEHTINNLGTSSENMTAAESRIRDVDMAKEMTAFKKNDILNQAAQAMLAQANQQPQGVLQLLR